MARACVLCVALCAWLVAWPARADDLRAAIEAQFARLEVAAIESDLPTLRAITTADVTFVLVEGDELDLEQWARLWGAASGLEVQALKYELQSVDGDGNRARTVAQVRLEASAGQGGAPVLYRVENVEHGQWLKAGGEWRLQRSATMQSRIWMGDTLVQDIAAAPPLDPARRSAIVEEMRARAIPFGSVDAGSGLDDLAALDAVIGDARIVALGEATHGTSEFFRMKHRLFEYLVEKKGFTVMAFEANWPLAEDAGRYVLAGEGDSAEALAQMGFWTWRTREVQGLVEWMRSRNSRPGGPAPLAFTGFDMQHTPSATRCVTDATDRLGGADAEAIRRYYEGTGDLYALMDPIGADPAVLLPAEEKARLRTNVAEALKLLDERREALLKLISPEEYLRVRRCAVIVVQASLPGAETEVDIVNARDQAMAENVRWLAEEAFPNRKIALWAHNGHVGAALEPGGIATMGRHLRQAYGDGLRIIGFAFDRGGVRARSMRDGKISTEGPIAMPVPAAKPTSAEAILRATGLPRFILDLRAVPPTTPLGAWLAAPQPLRTIGAVYDPDTPWMPYAPLPLREAFDALVFIAESTPSVALEGK